MLGFVKKKIKKRTGTKKISGFHTGIDSTEINHDDVLIILARGFHPEEEIVRKKAIKREKRSVLF